MSALPNTPKLPDDNGGKWVRIRLGFVFSLCLIFAGLIFFRLVQLQVIKNPDLETLAQKQFERVSKMAPPRLAIFDRNREELAVSIPASSIFIRPRLITRKHRAARALSDVLGGSPLKWLARFETQRPFVWIQRQVSEEVAREISKRKVGGIFLENENRRSYPNGMLASQLIGFTDIDGNGIAGVELSLNEELLKKPQSVTLLRDGKGTPTYIGKKMIRPDDGQSGVYLTLDRRLQHAVEEELDRTIEETSAKGAMAVVLDPFTGEIFSMAQRPGFDPNNPSSVHPSQLNNFLISHLYEPGSTIKTLMAAEAIQYGLLNEKSFINCEQGKFRIGDVTIGEAESNHRFGLIPLEKVIRVSSNIGAVKVAQMLGVERVRATLERFGFTQKTGIHLPGEVGANLKPDKAWKNVLLATAGFGQGFSVTPLQMTLSYAPFANGGYLIKPKIFLRENADKTPPLQRILKPTTVRTVKEMLVGVTQEDGTGFLAKIPEIQVAGKTGTAQKYEAGKGYASEKYFSSFIGFLPANEPELLIGVFVDEPKKPFYASQVAAPLFRKIAERSLQILNRLPKNRITEKELSPAGTVAVAPAARPILKTKGDGKWIMPDLTGLGVRDVLQIMGGHFENLKISGNGYLKDQSPKSGETVSETTALQFDFSGG